MIDYVYLANLLKQTVLGNIKEFSLLLGFSYKDIEQIKRQNIQLYLTKTALLTVLSYMKTNAYDKHLVQQWASFMIRGYIGRSFDDTHIRPLEIIYEPQFEEPITEVLSRLDELGDMVDGEIDDYELARLIKILK